MRRAALAMAFCWGLALTGCAGDGDKMAFLEAQLTALERQKPIWVLEAQEGRDIELKGVKRIAVYGQNGGAAQIRPLESQWPSVWREALRVAGTVGGIYYGGQALSDLAEAVGRHAGTHITGSFNPSGSLSPVGYSAGGGVNVSASSATNTTTTTTTTSTSSGDHGGGPGAP